MAGPAARPTSVGDTIGKKYRIDRLLGEGGMGAVYAAENLNTGRRVAVKVLHGEWTRHSSVVQRFLREARATTSIAHPNVVEVLDLDVDQDNGTPYIVQEFLEGETVEAHLASQPHERVDPAEALTILMPVMSAIVAAHERGIVHRDLKPANLFLSRARGGEIVPKVIDFGVAKNIDRAAEATSHTQAGAAIGTPAYMSPEQVSGLADIDEQTDVWSLGVVLYEMLTGHLPFESENANVLMAKILFEPPTPVAVHRSDLAGDVEEIILKALCRERGGRIRSVRELQSALLESSAGPAGPGASVRPAGKPPPPASMPSPERGSSSSEPVKAIGDDVTDPADGTVRPYGTAPLQDLARPVATPPMQAPASDPSPPPKPEPDTMHAVARVVAPTGPVAMPARRRWFVAGAVVVVLGLVVAAAALLGGRTEPVQTDAVSPVASPTSPPAAAPAPTVVPAPPVVAAPPPPPPVAAAPAPVVAVAAPAPRVAAPPAQPAITPTPRPGAPRRPDAAAPSNAPVVTLPGAPAPGSRRLNADEI